MITKAKTILPNTFLGRHYPSLALLHSLITTQIEQIWDISWYSNYTETNRTKPLQTHVYTISSNFFPNCTCGLLTFAASAVIASLLSKQRKEEEYTMNSKKSLITDCQSL